jgi:toxin FitB
VYLVDTNIVSELRKRKPHQGVVAWVRAIPEDDLHVCAVTLGEIQAGIEITRGQDPNKAAEIESWLDNLAHSYNIIPVDAGVFRRWAKLMHRRPDHHMEDALIAATALAHRLTVATRNVDAFRPFDVEIVNPFTTTEVAVE